MYLPHLNKHVRGVASRDSAFSFRGENPEKPSPTSLVVVDAQWIRDRLPPEAGCRNPDKAVQVHRWLTDNIEVWAPVVRLDRDDTMLNIHDGTHTLDALLKMGATTIALVVPALQAGAFPPAVATAGEGGLEPLGGNDQG